MMPTTDRPVSRRQLLAGAMSAGAVSVGRQFFTAPGAGAAATGTLVVVFLRGGMDGLSVLVPADDPHLLAARPDIVVRAGALQPLDRGFGLHPALAPLYPYWQRGQFTAVPAVSTPDISRSHFQAQDCIERGAASTQVGEGWLDRVLDKLAPTDVFRAVGQGTVLPRALGGDQRSLSLNLIDTFRIAAGQGMGDDTVTALQSLYKDLDHPLTVDVDSTLQAIASVAMVAAVDYTPSVPYPDNPFSTGLLQFARLIKVGAGLRIGCIDLGGWDLHVNAGSVDEGLMTKQLTLLGEGLAAFAADLGDRLDQVTVVVVTEFGRRVEQNSAGGTDHGHGAVVLALGGGLNGGKVHGNWEGLAPEVRENGDVPGWNDYRNVLGDLVVGRLGLSPADIAGVFPDHKYQSLGIMR